MVKFNQKIRELIVHPIVYDVTLVVFELWSTWIRDFTILWYNAKLVFLFSRKDCSLLSETSEKKSFFIKNTAKIDAYIDVFETVIFIDDKIDLIRSNTVKCIDIKAFKGEKDDRELLILKDKIASL